MMVPNEKARTPEIVDPPFTISSAEGLLLGVPIGIVMLVVGGALHVNISSFTTFLVVCIGTGIVSSTALSRRRVLEKLSGNQRTVLEMLILLGFASMTCLFLLKMFLEGRTTT